MFMTVWKDDSLDAARTCSRQTVPYSGSTEAKAALADWRPHSWQLDTSSRCRSQPRASLNTLQSPLTCILHSSSRQAGAAPWMHFYTRTAVSKSKMIRRRTGSQYRGLQWYGHGVVLQTVNKCSATTERPRELGDFKVVGQFEARF